jgi:hypothetical protein
MKNKLLIFVFLLASFACSQTSFDFLPDSIISAEITVWNYSAKLNKDDSEIIKLDKSIYKKFKKNIQSCKPDTELIGACMDGLPFRAIIKMVGNNNDSIYLFYSCYTDTLGYAVYRNKNEGHGIILSSKYQRWLSGVVTNIRKKAFKNTELY